MAKNVVVVIRDHPLSGDSFSEGLRMSVGMTIAGNRVTVILPEGSDTDPRPEKVGLGEIDMHFEGLSELKVTVLTRGICSERARMIDHIEFRNILDTSDVIIFW